MAPALWPRSLAALCCIVWSRANRRLNINTFSVNFCADDLPLADQSGQLGRALTRVSSLVASFSMHPQRSIKRIDLREYNKG